MEMNRLINQVSSMLARKDLCIDSLCTIQSVESMMLEALEGTTTLRLLDMLNQLNYR